VEAAALAVGVAPATLDEWVAEGVIPEYADDWTSAAIGKARLVSRILERGYTLAEVREASTAGRLVSGQLVELFGLGDGTYSQADVAAETGLDVSVVRRVAAMLGHGDEDELLEPDRELLRYIASAIELGLPLEAMLQLTRVYIQAMGQIADAEVRLVHLYVHEPLMRSGVSPEEMGRELFSLSEDLAPLADPILNRLHRRMLSHFILQDVVGHMESEPAEDESDVGRVLVAIAFADLAGYTQLTEQRGDLHALNVVERFVDTVTTTLPDTARVIKTIGDEVMLVGSDVEELTAWAAVLRDRLHDLPSPRIAVHYGYVRYRDGDYYGREVNLAARLAAESGPGEVLVTREVVDAGGESLRFAPIGEIRLRGFAESTQIFLASLGDEG